MKRPSYKLIQAAVNGDEAALQKIMKHYEPMIEAECGGNQLVCQQVTLALRETILHYDLNAPEKNESYLREQYPEAMDKSL